MPAPIRMCCVQHSSEEPLTTPDKMLSRISRVYRSQCVGSDGRRVGRRHRVLKVGDVRDLSNFTSAVIDQRAFTKHVQAIERARDSADAKIIAGGVADDREGWYVRPTLIISDNPRNDIFITEYFGPILGIHVFDDADFEAILDEVDRAAPMPLPAQC